MKEFFYVANIRMPTEKAHGIQIMEMCLAFSRQGVDVELVVPNRKTDIHTDPFDFYDIPPEFRIKKLWCLDTVRWGWIGFWIQTLTFGISLIMHFLRKEGVFYTRDESVAFLLTLLGKDVSWEAHMGQRNIFARLLITAKVRTIVITEGLRNLYDKLGLAREKILVAADGADVSRFDIDLAREDAREKLGLPKDKKIILYKGSLGRAKGAGTLAESASLTRSPNAVTVFIGGSPEDVESFRKEFGNSENILILGNRPRKETPVYQKAADILVIPNSAKDEMSKLYTSPMKLFGYMAGGVPIIASNLPSIREVLDESYAYFFKPDDPESLARTIDEVLRDYDEAKIRAGRSLGKVREYSWEFRAKKILSFIEA